MEILQNSLGFGTLFIIFLAIYLLSVYPAYKMYQLANLKNPWVAFIPVVGQIKMFNLANLSMWLYIPILLLSFIPFLGTLLVFIFMIYYTVTICKNFGLGILGCILAIFFGFFVYWYIALTNKQFVGNINPKYQDC